MSYSKPKYVPLIRKKDTNPFLDAALDFLFAIVEKEIQRKEPAYLTPTIHEFYFFSNQVSQLFQAKKKQKSRKSNRISPQLQTFFRHCLGSKLTLGLNESKQQKFTICLCTVCLAILAYSEYLTCMGVCSPSELSGHIQSAIYWYFSHYFMGSKHNQREKVLQTIWREVFQKRNQILKDFLHVKPSFQNVETCLDGMQNYFLSDSFQSIVQEIYKSVVSPV